MPRGSQGCLIRPAAQKSFNRRRTDAGRRLLPRLSLNVWLLLYRQARANTPGTDTDDLPPETFTPVDKLGAFVINRGGAGPRQATCGLRCAMSFKPEEYLHYFESYDLTHEEKIEFIETLWLIAQSFADDGLGIGSAANDNNDPSSEKGAA